MWTGQPIDYEGRHVELHGAICTPPPARPPRVVVGVGASRRTLQRATSIADEVNVYDQPEVIEAAVASARAGGPDVSVFVGWEWDKWPSDVDAELRRIRGHGIERLFVSLGGADMPERVAQLARAVAQM